MSSPKQNTIIDPNQASSSVRGNSPLRSLTGLVMDTLNFNICSSYVERQLEFEMQSDDVMTSNFGYNVEMAHHLEMAPKMFDEASVVESVTSRATSAVTTSTAERFSV